MGLVLVSMTALTKPGKFQSCIETKFSMMLLILKLHFFDPYIIIAYFSSTFIYLLFLIMLKNRILN